jgi:ADP-ribose pyrophosphatase
MALVAISSPWYLPAILGNEPKDAIEVLAEGKYLRLLNENGWEYVLRPNASGVVVMVAVTDDGRLILVEQFRTAVHRRVIELPAGLVGDTHQAIGESLVVAAHRELLEETGYEAREMLRLAEGPVAVGLASEVVTFFQAVGLRRVGPGGGDASESIVVHEVELGRLKPWLAARESAGAFIDPKLYAGLYLIAEGSPR